MDSPPGASPLMTGSMNWDPVRRRLLGVDLSDGLLAATELRENIDVVHGKEFPLMLSALLPSFSSVLTHRTKPSSDVSSVEHRFRNTILDIISKFPCNDVLRPHAPHLVALAIDILNRDYEDNALLACRIIFDLYKVYRALPQEYVQPYVDYVLNAYRSLPVAMQRNFVLPTTATATTVVAVEPTSAAKDDVKEGTTMTITAEAAESSTPSAPQVHALRSNVSFRVLTECPLMVMLMFQLYPKYVNNNVPVLIRVMMEALALRAPKLESLTGNQPSSPASSIDPQAKRLYFSRTRELVGAQAKTLSFLTYLLRSFSSELKAYEDRLASNVVSLMTICPRESVSTRKELLVATRHLLNSDFRKGFFKHVDVMLDERVLMGSHNPNVVSDQAMLRPLAYTTLSDLVQHVRTGLTMPQISRVVTIFSRVLHDSSMTLPMSTQYIAIRTLLSVVDVIFHNKDPNPQLGRDMLVRALSAMVNKLSSLCENFSLENDYAYNRSSKWVLGDLAPADSVRDIQSMIRAIIVGHKTIIYYLNGYRNQREKIGDKKDFRPTIPAGSNEEVSSGLFKLTHTEVALIDRFISATFPAVKLLTIPDPNHTTLPAEKSLVEQHRDALTYFASAFTTLDGHNLRRTLGLRMDLLYDAIVDDPTVMIVPRHLLAANGSTSFEFCSILLDFLMDHLNEISFSRNSDIVFLDQCPSIGSLDPKQHAENCLKRLTQLPPEGETARVRKSNTLLQLFERVLKSLSVFPDNEAAVRRHLRRIVATCLRNSMENVEAWPDNNCMLLRYVFRSISAGKFEESYRELLPLIPFVLNGLHRIISLSKDSLVLRQTAIELCLTIPARLSSLLPHLNLLLRIIIPALESSLGDLVNLGLRTLEFWIDNLNPLFLHPEISKEKETFSCLMVALSRHLRPAPYPYGLLTLRLLGKLGGKNREFLREPMSLPPGPEMSDNSCFVRCRWKKDDGFLCSTQSEFPLPYPLGRCIRLLKLVAQEEITRNQLKIDDARDAPCAIVSTWNDSEKLWGCRIFEVDFPAYSRDVSKVILCKQSRAALNVLRHSFLHALDSNESTTKTECNSECKRKIIRDCLCGLMLAGMIDSLKKEAVRLVTANLSRIPVDELITSFSAFIVVAPLGSETVVKELLAKFVQIEGTPDDSQQDTLCSCLASLCEGYGGSTWYKHRAFQAAILFVIDLMDQSTIQKLELNLVNSSFVAIKSIPRELSRKGVEAALFAIRLCCRLYRPSAAFEESIILWDGDNTDMNNAEADAVSQNCCRPNADSFKIIFQSIASMQHLVRFTARFVLVNFILRPFSVEQNKEFVAEHMSFITRVLFSRSLRLMPLPQQAGIVDGLTVVINELPNLIPLSDQHLLAFLSELLKMSSVADGEMTDNTLANSVVDKNGYVGTPIDLNTHFRPSHAAALFNRRECMARFQKAWLDVPDECPVGVELRVASIRLFHVAIKVHTDAFFDADTSTPIGNIRPHVVSLLFRSLVSFPLRAVNAAHCALGDVLSLSVVAKSGESSDKPQSRLPKELLQTCIRPVLLHLREYTRLSVPLLRGLSRLLDLLSSWFNKTLGEKLLDHLQKWADPPRIVGHSIWKQGTEPLVAAGIIDIFASLPHSPNFVEPLVKTCIKLEAALPAFKGRFLTSPYRQPLANYLNKHPQVTVNFFFQRFKTPMYSELFQDLLTHNQSTELRLYLRSKQSSAMLLNVCFERPLAIIRAEKTVSAGTTKASLATHGILFQSTSPDQSGMTVDALEMQYQGFRLVNTLLSYDPEYFGEHNDIVRAFRWLWRSKGRYLRMQHEDLVHPRYHDESAMLAKFLIAYAKFVPNEDMDILFELIRVFLQPSTSDYSGVGQFLARTVSTVLTPGQKRQVIHRFFALIVGESNEETKLLSIQFLIYPIFRSTGVRYSETEAPNNSAESSNFVDADIVEKFTHEVIYRKGSPISCGDRLKVELLKLLNVFINQYPHFVEPYRDDVFQFCWPLVKSEDAACKGWAHLVVACFVKTFATPVKVVTKSYESLLRSHQQEGKDLIKNALDVLVPCLPKRLPEKDLKNAIEQTCQLLLEEGNSTPQLAHICQTIVSSPNTFFPCRARIVGYLISSLHRLGLPQNTSLECRSLVVDLVCLLLSWNEKQKAEIGGEILTRDQGESLANFLVRLRLLIAEPPDPRHKFEATGSPKLERKANEVIERLLELWTVSLLPTPFEKAIVKDQASDSQTIACLQLLTVIASTGHHIFFRDNQSLVRDLLRTSFFKAKESENVQETLKAFLERGKTNVIVGTDVVTILDSFISDIVHEQRKKRRASDQEQGSTSKSRDRQGSDDGLVNSFAIFVLQMISLFCLNKKHLLQVVLRSLVSFGGILTKSHLSDAAAKQRQGSPNSPHILSPGRQSHTPTSGILGEAFRVDSRNSPKLNPIKSKFAKDNEASASQVALVEILSLLETSEINLAFTTTRKALFQMICNLLDSSDSTQVLLITARISGKWIIGNDDGVPLTTKERLCLLGKIATLDSTAISSDLEAQPLNDFVSIFIEKYSDSLKVTDQLDMGKFHVVSLLHSNVEVRDRTWKWLSGGKPITIAHFCEILHVNLEALGGRFWITVLVDVLLMSSSDDGSGLLQSLRTLAHADPTLSLQLFTSLLQAVWQHMPTDSLRVKITASLELLLSRPYHAQALGSEETEDDSRCSNAVRALVNALLLLQPAPLIDMTVLVAVAESYNSWREVLSILEIYYVGLQGHPLGADCLHAMRACLQRLEEDSMWMGISALSCKLPQTRRVLSKEVYGMVNEAIAGYAGLMELVQDENSPVEVDDFEMSLWEDRWIGLQKDTCQLDLVSEYATETGNPHLMLECSWKTRNWAKVRSLCSSPNLLSSVEAGDPLIKLSETLLAVADGKLSDVENLHAQTAQLCLHKWQLLPKLSSGSASHASTLHFFHRLVEIRESGQIMVETNNHSSAKTLPDLKNLLNAWRHRLPCESDKLSAWDDVCAWREHMFSAVTSNFHWSEPNTLATLHDRPWTIIRMAKTARKQGMRDVSLHFLNKASEERSMNVSDAFLKLREQILAYFNPDSELERHGGLNLINSTNLSFFDQTQKSELFRLKAQFLSSLGSRSKANQAYCHSVEICPTHARAWNSWGELCSSLGAVAEKQAEQGSVTGSTEDNVSQDKSIAAKKVAQYLAQAMGCYLEAVRIDGNEWARVHLPKCLWILSKDSTSSNILSQTLEDRGKLIPAWVWLPWVPQLLTCFYRPEGQAVKTIFSDLVRCYPQAVYYPLRSFYLERRDVERGRSSNAQESQQMGSVGLAEVMMSLLRRSHASLWSTLESVLEELIVKFRPSYEEELLSTLVALLERAEAQVGTVGKNCDEEGVIVPVWKTLGRIAVKFFRPVDEGSAKRDERARKTTQFKAAYKDQFERDFDVKSEGDAALVTEGQPSFSLEELLEKLSAWKEKLEKYVLSMPKSMSLIETSPSLAIFGVGDSPDLWPGSCDPLSQGMKGERDFLSDDDATSSTSITSTSSSAAAAQKASYISSKAAAAEAMREGVGGYYGGGSSRIEVPGQYAPNSSFWADSRPSPELHAKMIKIEQSVEVLRRNDQLVRRIGIVASNGKTYRFLLQFAVPYWTRTDERTAQVHYLLDKVIRKDIRSVRANLSVQPQAVIPVAQRLRLICEPEDRVSLDEIYRQHCAKIDIDPPALCQVHTKQIKTLLMEIAQANNEDKKDCAIAEEEGKLRIFDEIVSWKGAESNIISCYLQSTMKCSESVFQFRRSFAQQWAINCLLQFVFSISDRSPTRVVFVASSGRVLAPDFRVSYSSQGFMETPRVPFRLTSNLFDTIGVTFLESTFITSICRVAAAVRSRRHDIDPTLRLLMRDDLVTFYTKSMAKSDSQTQEMEKQLGDRVSRNVANLHSKFSECCPTHGIASSGNSDDKEPDDTVDERVRRLLASARSHSNLSQMPTSFQGWL
ncbi:transformation/transcription domain-associated protein [Fistulifera solaris]|uniref:Transformation/transcription domain-associated protein n=1 Tax=Fistulifera solaris TaxID=1519565 RepID=A0A1Z5KEA4_FISSO|nr:transformation/transcription domain-associated protein [Fistulifera solaris]|eukprot:GAX24432.1 transformation/transcription domain-associated protein [Fistulifera solaris]